MVAHKATPKWIDFVGIVLMATLCAVVYGVLQDQLSIRISPAYFLKAHTKILETEDLTLVGLAWGVTATWWVGLALGFAVATFATYGPRAAYCPGRALRGMMRIMAGTGIATLAVGLIAYMMNWTSSVAFRFVDLPEEVRRFSAVQAAHNASYLAAPTLAVLLIRQVWTSRSMFSCAG
jgi:hypothetical protein